MRHATSYPARTRLSLALAALGVTVAGLTIGAGLPAGGVGAPTPTHAATEQCEEDMPCWNCQEMGNHVCGSADDSATAWATWEEQDGAHSLKVDPSRPFRVDYMASSEEYPQNMDAYDLALVGKDGKWYVFRASYTDK